MYGQSLYLHNMHMSCSVLWNIKAEYWLVYLLVPMQNILYVSNITFFKLANLIIFNLLCVAMSVDNGKITKCRLIIMISFHSENNEWARSVKLGEGLLWPAKSTKTLFIFLITYKIWSDTPPLSHPSNRMALLRLCYNEFYPPFLNSELFFHE